MNFAVQKEKKYKNIVMSQFEFEFFTRQFVSTRIIQNSNVLSSSLVMYVTKETTYFVTSQTVG